jgi:hypothetical protein
VPVTGGDRDTGRRQVGPGATQAPDGGKPQPGPSRPSHESPVTGTRDSDRDDHELSLTVTGGLTARRAAAGGDITVTRTHDHQ